MTDEPATSPNPLLTPDPDPDPDRTKGDASRLAVPIVVNLEEDAVVGVGTAGIEFIAAIMARRRDSLARSFSSGVSWTLRGALGRADVVVVVEVDRGVTWDDGNDLMVGGSFRL